MQKISPLRSSIEAFNKFKLTRTNKTENARNATNPFGIAFKGTVIQMDVFEKAEKNEAPMSPSLQKRLQDTGKLLASAWVGTINKFNQLKQNAIAFGNRIKQSSINTFNKVVEIGGKKVEFDYFNYNVSNLAKKPVSELENMLKSELNKVQEV